MDFSTIGAANKYTDDSIAGTAGVLAGKNCTIDSTTKTGSVTTVVFKWTADDNTVHTSSIQVNDGAKGDTGDTGASGTDGTNGVSVVSMVINANNHLICTMSDGSTIDAGEVPTGSGGATQLNELTDVTITNASSGQSLIYNGAEWVNVANTTLSGNITLPVANWDTTTLTQTVQMAVDTTKLNTPYPSTTSLEEYASSGIYLSSETSTGLTFTCKAIPDNDVVIRLKSEVVVG